jgi:hypothetical protein
VDAQGNLYVASHWLADVELRRYAPDGSLTYDSLVRSCGGGFVAIAAIAIDKIGRAWIAGNTTACLPTTPAAFTTQIGEPAGPRGFLMLIDTTKPSSAPPVYVTYLSQVENRIRALRVDSDGNAYVTGTAASAQFPHESTLSVGKSNVGARGTEIGFVSVLNAPGSALRWSVLLQGARLNALALDGLGNVYVTGRMVSRRPGPVFGEILVAAVSDNGRRLSYVARFGGSGGGEGRAISTNSAANWVLVAGETESAGFPAGSTAKTSPHKVPQSFAIALQPCTAGSVYARLFAARDDGNSPEIAPGQHAPRQIQAMELQIAVEVGPIGARANRHLEEPCRRAQFQQLEVGAAPGLFGSALQPGIESGRQVVERCETVVQPLITGVGAIDLSRHCENGNAVAKRI